MRLAVRGDVLLFISADVITEARRNITNKSPDYPPILDFLLDLGVFSKAPEPSPQNVQAATQYTEQKDAMIVAAAILGDVTYLATFDRKHLIDPPEVGQKSGLIITTPGSILRSIRPAFSEGRSSTTEK